MATLDLSAASAVLKNFYIGPIREQINNASILLARIDREDQEVFGTEFTVPLHTGRNWASGSGRAEGADLPTARTQRYNKAIVPNKYTYGRITVSGPLIKAARSNAGSFIRAIESEIKGCVRDTKRSFNRQLHGDGRDQLALVRSNIAASTSGTLHDGKNNPFIHIQSGQSVDVYAAAATTASSALYSDITVTVTGEAATHKTVTFGSAVTLTAGDYLVLPGTFNAQMMGIAGIIDNTDPGLLSGGLHGLPVASNEYWKAQVITGAVAGTNEALTLARMQRPLSQIVVNSDYSDADVSFLLGNVYVRDTYVNLLTSLKRFVNTMKLDGGFSAVMFNDIPFVVDTQCKRNRLYYIVPETMKIFRTSDIDWMDEDGAILSRVSNKDAYEAVLYHYGDLACLTRNGNGVLLDITES